MLLRDFLRSIRGGLASKARIEEAKAADAELDAEIDHAIHAVIVTNVDGLSDQGGAIERLSCIVASWCSEIDSVRLSARLHKAAALHDAEMISAVESALEDYVDGNEAGAWLIQLKDWILDVLPYSPTSPPRTPLWLGTVGGVKRRRAGDDSSDDSGDDSSDDAARPAAKKQRANVVDVANVELEEGEVVLV